MCQDTRSAGCRQKQGPRNESQPHIIRDLSINTSLAHVVRHATCRHVIIKYPGDRDDQGFKCFRPHPTPPEGVEHRIESPPEPRPRHDSTRRTDSRPDTGTSQRLRTTGERTSLPQTLRRHVPVVGDLGPPAVRGRPLPGPDPLRPHRHDSLLTGFHSTTTARESDQVSEVERFGTLPRVCSRTH